MDINTTIYGKYKYTKLLVLEQHITRLQALLDQEKTERVLCETQLRACEAVSLERQSAILVRDREISEFKEHIERLTHEVDG